MSKLEISATSLKCVSFGRQGKSIRGARECQKAPRGPQLFVIIGTDYVINSSLVKKSCTFGHYLNSQHCFAGKVINASMWGGGD